MIKLALAKTLHVLSYLVWLPLPFMVMIIWAYIAAYSLWVVLKECTQSVHSKCKDSQEKILLWYLKSS